MTKTPILLSALIVLTLGAHMPGSAQTGAAEAAAASEDPQAASLDLWLEDKTRVFEASEIDLDLFRWVARPVVVFAESSAVPAFQDQMDFIASRADDLARRDVVVITDTNPEVMSDLRRALRPRGFQLTLLGKDGEVKLRKPSPWQVREITRSIDKMPMRQREIREGG